MASRSNPRDPFAGRSHSPREHFRLCFYTAVLHLRERLDQLGVTAAGLERFPFLAGYFDQLQDGSPARWEARLEAWEAASPVRLPLVELRRAAGLSRLALGVLFVAGLPEEDARFGALLEAVQGTPGQQRPTLGLLAGGGDEPAGRPSARQAVLDLLDRALLEVVNVEAPRSQWAVQPPPLLWDAIRGDVREELAPWVRFVPPERLPTADTLLLAEAARARLANLPALLEARAAGCVIVRGAPSSGRRTTLRTIAGTLGRGALELDGLGDHADGRWPLVGPLATLLHAMPLVALDPGLGEAVEVPRLAAFDGPVGVALPHHGGIAGPGTDRSVTLVMDFPDAAARRRHWESGLAGHGATDVHALAGEHRMTGGTIRRVAAMAVAEARLEGRRTVTAADVRAATRTVRAGLLDLLVTRVPVAGTWDDLAVSPAVREELLLLERRCRSRERLGASLSAAFGGSSAPGVRALFTGPSGTGKSLAARLLASALGKDLYRLDLSAVVNKYLGETEKNLERVLGHAETLDVVLLIDEGDALLARRTEVHTSNDRYANLETNYLLQRLESFEGILVVTTNAEQRLDAAFERRLDVVIDFSLPGPPERLAIWRLHLPGDHAVDGELLRELAARCAMTGGQIHNAVVHALLLALDEGGVATAAHVEAAVRREYRKAGVVCPLRPASRNGHA